MPSLRLQPVDSKNLADRVADQLRETIQSGAYAPGERLVERRLAAELGVSHIPVREALTRLIEEGLVERLPRRGCRVAAINAKELRDLSRLRVLLEQYVAERAIENWNDQAERSLREIVAQMEAAADRGDTRRLSNLDVRFHEELWALTDDEILIDLVAQLRGRIGGFLRAATTALEPAALRAHASSHGELIDALSARRVGPAKRAMARHIEVAAQRVGDALPPEAG
ncbi:GntR family transcriptional regulator [Conexibacter stalactiti]|uniref:GntR family transcriptional regulator n=1 Tax=Conexibacter stalactiti TaxID=1940611 RepID=A0ABU4HHZ3_9ACTN|nr:GntR family transcriptional regulator [Conexibacter stalactiti]MDW5592923.1 GntR family transcriptional regulator [Conexibacter stalactiti]MEC5033564.1 GntR family transcriptional regulator [Conexibacter stalactiti]